MSRADDVISSAEIPADLAPRLQLSHYRAETSAADTEDLVDAAARLGAPAVSVFPVFVTAAARRAAGRVRVVAKVGHLGLAKPTIKAIEATSCIKDGAVEIQVEPLLCEQAAGNFDATKFELQEVVRACRATGRETTIRAVVRSMYLFREGGERLVEGVCRAVREGACDGILDIGDDASHRLVRTHATGLELSRCMPAVEWHGVRDCLAAAPHLRRVEVFVELFGITSIREILR